MKAAPFSLQDALDDTEVSNESNIEYFIADKSIKAV